MKRLIILSFMLSLICSMSAQQDLINEIKRQATDSLSKVLNTEREKNSSNIILYQKAIKNTGDTINSLKTELLSLKKFKSEKKKFDIQLKEKIDSIIGLKNLISERDKQTLLERSSCEIKSKEEFKNGQKSSLDNIANAYKTKTFDDLIQNLTLETVNRDRNLLENYTDMNQLFSDLISCYEAKELLKYKFDTQKVKEYMIKLGQIKQKSGALEKLKSDIENYESFNSGLKECIGKLIALDNEESVAGMSDDVQKMKFNKILRVLAETSSFIFNYDFKFKDYPYLSEILSEVFKLKQPNPDAEIADLMQKL